MRLIDRYSKADPVPVTVAWPRPAGAMLQALGAATATEHLATAPDGERLVYRLEGAVDGRQVALRVSFSGTHLGTGPCYSVTGVVNDTGAGSELRGELVLPGAASRTWVLVLVVLAAMGVLLVAAGFPEALPLWAIGFFTLLFAPELRTRTLRRRARDVEAILAAIERRADALAPVPMS